MTEYTLLVILLVMLGVSLAIVLGYIALLTWQLFEILKEVRELISTVRRIMGGAEKDIIELRARVREEGFKARAVFDMILRAVGSVGRRVRRRSSKSESEEE